MRGPLTATSCLTHQRRPGTNVNSKFMIRQHAPLQQRITATRRSNRVQQRKAQHQSRPRVARLSTAGGFFRLLTVMARIEHRGVGDPGGYPYRPHPRKKREAIGVLVTSCGGGEGTRNGGGVSSGLERRGNNENGKGNQPQPRRALRPVQDRGCVGKRA